MRRAISKVGAFAATTARAAADGSPFQRVRAFAHRRAISAAAGALDDRQRHRNADAGTEGEKNAEGKTMSYGPSIGWTCAALFEGYRSTEFGPTGIAERALHRAEGLARRGWMSDVWIDRVRSAAAASHDRWRAGDRGGVPRPLEGVPFVVGDFYWDGPVRDTLERLGGAVCTGRASAADGSAAACVAAGAACFAVSDAWRWRPAAAALGVRAISLPASTLGFTHSSPAVFSNDAGDAFDVLALCARDNRRRFPDAADDALQPGDVRIRIADRDGWWQESNPLRPAMGALLAEFRSAGMPGYAVPRFADVLITVRRTKQRLQKKNERPAGDETRTEIVPCRRAPRTAVRCERSCAKRRTERASPFGDDPARPVAAEVALPVGRWFRDYGDDDDGLPRADVLSLAAPASARGLQALRLACSAVESRRLCRPLAAWDLPPLADLLAREGAPSPAEYERNVLAFRRVVISSLRCSRPATEEESSQPWVLQEIAHSEDANNADLWVRRARRPE